MFAFFCIIHCKLISKELLIDLTLHGYGACTFLRFLNCHILHLFEIFRNENIHLFEISCKNRVLVLYPHCEGRYKAKVNHGEN